MSRFFFIILLVLLTIVRPLISILVVVIRPLVPFLKNRLNFERKNFLDPAHHNHFQADLCFEVSSEGELEQVRALMTEALMRNKKIEILYSSPSVEVKCQGLYNSYPNQVRLMRLPLLSAFPFDFLYFKSVWQWVSAPVIVFCRYDFFPELMMLKFFNKKFILISGAFKKLSWYKKESFKFFDFVVAATDLEKKNFEELLGDRARIYSCDFRVPRVTERFNSAEKTILSKSWMENYIRILSDIPRHKKIILGSAWESDLQILENPELVKLVKAGNLHLLILPHKLDNDTSAMLLKKLQSIFEGAAVGIVNDQQPYKGSDVVILQTGGVLCELYSLFSLSYVGGGYERSIHSVLEPIFSNSAVITGPKIARSTEYDLASQLVPREIHVLNNPESFYTIIESIDVNALDIPARVNFAARTSKDMQNIFQDILGK